MVANGSTARWLRPILALFALTGLGLLGGCGGGSGAPNNPYAPKPPTPTAVAILPTVATAYSNTPSTLTVSGGVPPYTMFSSNSAILPVAQSNTTGTVVLLPATVPADTAVIITAVDSIGQRATATVTVKPAPIFNTLTVTPNSAACGTNAVCSGQTATASVTVTGPGGAGIPNRQVRFDVVSGAFSIQSSDPANPLVPTLTVVSDAFGVAQVILQAAANAFTQPALLRATELTTENQQTAQFTIVQTINGSAVLSVVPPDVTIKGPFTGVCSTGVRVDYYIYGGTPPYTVAATLPDTVGIFNTPVLAPGQAFTVITNSSCVDPVTFTIRDATGLQTTATLHNVVGDTPPPTAPPAALDVTPASQNVASCTGKTVSALVTGGTAPYSVSAQTVGGVTPLVSPVPLNAPGYIQISGMATAGGTYNFLVSDASTPQQTAAFKITCP